MSENHSIVSGVYCIRNLVNGKVYIGSGQNVFERFRDHKSLLRKGTHNSRYLQNSWNKYGELWFSFSPLMFCPVADLVSREQEFIDLYLSSDRDCGYNICERAYIPPNLKGISKSEETKKKMSEYHLNRPAEHQRKITESISGKKNGMYGKKHPPEMIEHYRRKSTGKKHGEETKKKISDSQKGEKNHAFGKKLSVETRRKKSEATAMFTDEQAIDMRYMRSMGMTWKKIAEFFNCSQSCARRVVNGDRMAYRTEK